ncbi:MAG: STAS domain-containing protein [Saprospiraceae bacterium]|nr:STAS domain-containing protein [Saprospiraceae bacterium]
MKYNVEKQEQYAILTLSEENLNTLKAPDLKSEFVLLKQAGTPNLILNLEQVKYVDSSGLSAILTGNRMWTEEGKQFILAGVNHPSVKMLITISRLDSVLNIKETNQAAVKEIMMAVFREELSGSNEDTTADEDDE